MVLLGRGHGLWLRRDCGLRNFSITTTSSTLPHKILFIKKRANNLNYCNFMRNPNNVRADLGPHISTKHTRAHTRAHTRSVKPSVMVQFTQRSPEVVFLLLRVNWCQRLEVKLTPCDLLPLSSPYTAQHTGHLGARRHGIIKGNEMTRSL